MMGTEMVSFNHFIQLMAQEDFIKTVYFLIFLCTTHILNSQLSR